MAGDNGGEGWFRGRMRDNEGKLTGDEMLDAHVLNRIGHSCKGTEIGGC